MTPPSIFHHHHLLVLLPLPSASPTQILNPFAISSRRLNHQLPKPVVLSLSSRPVISSAFAVAAVGDDEDVVVGDCLVFDDDAFEEPDLDLPLSPLPRASASRHGRRAEAGEGESLVPERWRDAEEEINLTKKEKRRIAHGLRFGSRLERRAPPAVAAPDEFRAYRKGMLSAECDHVAHVYRGPMERALPPEVEEPPPPKPGTRVAPRNPRMGIDIGSLEDIDEFFRSREYVQDEMEDSKSPKGRQKLFSNEEKVLLNKRVPDLEAATSSKWLPLHTLAASGDFYLLDSLLKHNVDINALDKDGATVMHYAVQTACSQTIKTLLLYNVDINRPDDYGWTPLHLAVQTQRTDIVKLLLIKGADRTLKTQDGLTPLELCLRLGHDVQTYELIKLLKSFQRQKQHDLV